MAVRITLRLDRTEFLIVEEALTYFAVDQRYRADRGRDRSQQLLWAVQADELRRLVTRQPERHTGVRVVPVSLTADRALVLTSAVDSWATRQEAAATSPAAIYEDPYRFEEAASIARAVLVDVWAQIIEHP